MHELLLLQQQRRIASRACASGPVGEAVATTRGTPSLETPRGLLSGTDSFGGTIGGGSLGSRNQEMLIVEGYRNLVMPAG